MSIGAKIVFLQNCQDVKMSFLKRKLHFAFLLLLQKDKQKKRKTQTGKGKNYKIVFLRWSSKNEKHERWIFTKNCLTLFVSERERNGFFVHTICFGQICLGHSSQNEENTKDWFQRKLPKTKNETILNSLEKDFFGDA